MNFIRAAIGARRAASLMLRNSPLTEEAAHLAAIEAQKPTSRVFSKDFEFIPIKSLLSGDYSSNATSLVDFPTGPARYTTVRANPTRTTRAKTLKSRARAKSWVADTIASSWSSTMLGGMGGLILGPEDESPWKRFAIGAGTGFGLSATRAALSGARIMRSANRTAAAAATQSGITAKARAAATKAIPSKVRNLLNFSDKGVRDTLFATGAFVTGGMATAAFSNRKRYETGYGNYRGNRF